MDFSSDTTKCIAAALVDFGFDGVFAEDLTPGDLEEAEFQIANFFAKNDDDIKSYADCMESAQSEIDEYQPLLLSTGRSLSVQDPVVRHVELNRYERDGANQGLVGLEGDRDGLLAILESVDSCARYGSPCGFAWSIQDRSGIDGGDGPFDPDTPELPFVA